MAAQSQLDFITPLRAVPKLGPKRQSALEAAGIKDIGGLFRYYPSKYIDRSKQTPIKDARDFGENAVTVRGTVKKVYVDYWRKARYRVLISDDSGELEALWYFRAMKVALGDVLILTGKVAESHGKSMMFHPVYEKVTPENETRPILAMYSIKEAMREAGISQKMLRQWIDWVIKNVGNYPKVLPSAIESKHNFPPLNECLKQIHLPDDLAELDKYKKRLKYEELYKLALNLRWNRKKFALPGRAMSAGKLDAKMRALLPFTLTDSQELALKILRDDAAEPARMHRLLQGDVGSGKTITALMATLPALNSGRQVAWMAPTEVLAKQTKSVVEKYLDNLGFRVEYLGAGDMREKREIQSGLASGELRFIVGTHALFMPSVQFLDLGMVIIDEQHKFGAAQRLKLQEKGPSSDFLLMSATPIPQTLAKTLYGDLDVVEIASRPDRAPISTHIVPEGKRGDMEKFILEQIRGGARAFYVVPRIDQIDDTGDDGDEAEENSASKSGGMSGRQFKQATSGKSVKAVSSNSNIKESIANKSVSKSYHQIKQATASKSVNNIYNKTSSDNTSDIATSIKTVDSAADMLMAGPLSAVPIHRLHGRMLYNEREMTINAFRNGEPGILVATTIVEVGIDVSDATVMVIENPEYFGLAQLHQIRGRVGRSDKQSYCFLLLGANQNDGTMERLKFLCGCNDGFKIAEWDLRSRGPGDAAGSRQSGWDDLRAADILEDADMFREIMTETENLFK